MNATAPQQQGSTVSADMMLADCRRLWTLGRVACQMRLPLGRLRKLLDQHEIAPALTINDCEHYSEADIAKIMGTDLRQSDPRGVGQNR